MSKEKVPCGMCQGFPVLSKRFTERDLSGVEPGYSLLRKPCQKAGVLMALWILNIVTSACTKGILGAKSVNEICQQYVPFNLMFPPDPIVHFDLIPSTVVYLAAERAS